MLFTRIYKYLKDLLDVSVSAPTDGQVLKYQASSSKWINSTAPSSSDPTKLPLAGGVMTGNIQTFTPSFFLSPVVNPTTQNVTITSGVNNGNTNAGNLTLSGGVQQGFSGNGGNVNIVAGYAANGSFGNVLIKDGNSTTQVTVNSNGTALDGDLTMDGNYIHFNGNSQINGYGNDLYINTTGYCYLYGEGIIANGIISLDGGAIGTDGDGNLTATSLTVSGSGITIGSARIQSDTGSGDLFTSGGITLDDGLGNMSVTSLTTANGITIGTARIQSDTGSGDLFTSGGVTLDDGSGNMSIGSAVTAHAFYLNSGDIGNLIGGFIPDYAGLPIMDFGLNATQFGTTNTDLNGSLFRLDNRGDYPFFQVIYQAPSTSTEYVPLSVQNPNDDSMPAVFIGYPTDGENTGYGNGNNLQVYGTAQAAVFQGAYSHTLLAKIANYTLTATDDIILVNSASNITMTLPSAASAGQGRQYTIKTINTAATVKTSASGQKIDGTDYSSTGYSLSAVNKYITIVSNGSGWYIVASN
jgi:hypothetical protein